MRKDNILQVPMLLAALSPERAPQGATACERCARVCCIPQLFGDLLFVLRALSPVRHNHRRVVCSFVFGIFRITPLGFCVVWFRILKSARAEGTSSTRDIYRLFVYTKKSRFLLGFGRFRRDNWWFCVACREFLVMGGMGGGLDPPPR